MVLPLTLQLTNMSRQIAMQITDLFEEIGIVQEGMITIAQPLQLVDSGRARSRSIVREGKIAFEDVRFGYGRETGVLEGFSLDGAPRREDRPGRPLRRRQVDRGQSAAALLRSRRRPHPDRRPGHLAGHAGKPARADLRGDAGHLAAASLDPREHPLRPARTRARPRSSRRRNSPTPTSSSISWKTGAGGTATTPRWASAASSSPAASASASRSRA